MNYAKQKQLDIYKSQIKKEQDDLVIEITDNEDYKSEHH